MSEYAHISIQQTSNGWEVSGNTKAEELYQLKRIADALEALASK